MDSDEERHQSADASIQAEGFESCVAHIARKPFHAKFLSTSTRVPSGSSMVRMVRLFRAGRDGFTLLALNMASLIASGHIDRIIVSKYIMNPPNNKQFQGPTAVNNNDGQYRRFKLQVKSNSTQRRRLSEPEHRHLGLVPEEEADRDP